MNNDNYLFEELDISGYEQTNEKEKNEYFSTKMNSLSDKLDYHLNCVKRASKNNINDNLLNDNKVYTNNNEDKNDCYFSDYQFEKLKKSEQIKPNKELKLNYNESDNIIDIDSDNIIDINSDNTININSDNIIDFNQDLNYLISQNLNMIINPELTKEERNNQIKFVNIICFCMKKRHE